MAAQAARDALFASWQPLLQSLLPESHVDSQNSGELKKS